MESRCLCEVASIRELSGFIVSRQTGSTDRIMQIFLLFSFFFSCSRKLVSATSKDFWTKQIFFGNSSTFDRRTGKHLTLIILASIGCAYAMCTCQKWHFYVSTVCLFVFISVTKLYIYLPHFNGHSEITLGCGLTVSMHPWPNEKQMVDYPRIETHLQGQEVKVWWSRFLVLYHGVDFSLQSIW